MTDQQKKPSTFDRMKQLMQMAAQALAIFCSVMFHGGFNFGQIMLAVLFPKIYIAVSIYEKGGIVPFKDALMGTKG
jgi:hypothetical protein